MVDECVGLAIRGDDHAGDAINEVVGVADDFAAAREPAQSPDDVIQAREAGAVGVAGGEWVGGFDQVTGSVVIELCLVADGIGCWQYLAAVLQV